MADKQRQQVYDAENELSNLYNWTVQTDSHEVTVGGVTLTLPPEAKFGSVESVQAYVKRVVEMPSVREALGDRGIPKVRKRQGSKSAHYESSTNTIAVHDGRDNWAMRELVILHELAHHFTVGDHHGPRFAQAFLVLLENVMGPQTALALRILFGDHEVSTGAKKGLVSA